MANLRVDKITSTETFEKTGSVQFDGNSDWLDIASSNDFAYGTGDFTWEAWFYPASVKTHYIFDHGNDGGVIQFYDGIIRYYNSTIGVTSILYTGGGTLDYSTWSHIAVSRNSGISRLFVNGQLKCLGPDAHSYSAQAVTIGDYGANSGTNKTQGFISNARLVKGKALYTSNFKPPMRELEVTAETVLLACQSKTDASLEKTGKTITVNGNAVASELTPGILTPIVKSGGGSAITGSVEFSGAPAATVGTDYLNVSSTDFAFGTSDFSVEMWFNSGDVSAEGQRGLIQLSDTVGGLKTNYTSGFVIATGVNNAGNASVNDIYSQILGDNLGSNDDPLRNDTWHHVALTRQSGTARLFLNGILLGSSSAAESISAEHLVIGGWYSTSYLHKGFISNLRIVRGTALYTADFIPPTRELKKVPGTVLLCCQDSNNPLTEATGKTITGYGNLQRADGPELVTNGYFDNGTTGWSVTGGAIVVTSGQLQLTNSNTTLGKVDQTITTVVGQIYQVSALITPDGGGHFPRLYVGADDFTPVLSSTNIQQLVTVIHTAVSTSTVISLNSNTNNANAVTLFDDVSAYDISYDADAPASNFTPQIGDDRQITFEGVTKINTDAYFYFPTGDTASREATGTYNAGTRGIFGAIGVYPNSSVTIHYSTIATFGNTVDFGDLNESRRYAAGCSSKTRGLFGGGAEAAPGPAIRDSIDHITIATTGNASDFGNLTQARWAPSAFSNATRGIWFSGNTSPANTNVIDYVTIASTGNALDFGDAFSERRYCLGSTSDSTRGIDSGGNEPGYRNVIQYVTIASTGNAQDFGDLMQESLGGCGGVSNGTRGVFAGGYTPTQINTIQYITIQSMGNSKDFGDMTSTDARHGAAAESSIRGLFTHGGYPSRLNTIDAITIATTGNAVEFGDIIDIGGNDGGGDSGTQSGFSNGHGGLG